VTVRKNERTATYEVEKVLVVDQTRRLFVLLAYILEEGVHGLSDLCFLDF